MSKKQLTYGVLSASLVYVQEYYNPRGSGKEVKLDEAAVVGVASAGAKALADNMTKRKDLLYHGGVGLASTLARLYAIDYYKDNKIDTEISFFTSPAGMMVLGSAAVMNGIASWVSDKYF